MADFFASPIEARDSEMISSVFWRKKECSAQSFICVAIWKQSFWNWGGEKDILRKTKADIFTTKRTSLKETSCRRK